MLSSSEIKISELVSYIYKETGLKYLPIYNPNVIREIKPWLLLKCDYKVGQVIKQYKAGGRPGHYLIESINLRNIDLPIVDAEEDVWDTKISPKATIHYYINTIEVLKK